MFNVMVNFVSVLDKFFCVLLVDWVKVIVMVNGNILMVIGVVVGIVDIIVMISDGNFVVVCKVIVIVV